MKRWGLAIAGLVAVAVAVNLVVAWAGAIWSDLTGFDPQHTAHLRHELDEAGAAGDDDVWIDSAWRGPLFDVIITLDERGKTITHEAGWPRRVLRGRQRLAPRPSTESSSQRAVVLRRKLTLSYRSDKTFVVRDKVLRLIPLEPIWGGLLLNTALFAVVVAVIVAGAHLIRRVARSLRQRCPRCGYRLVSGPASGCPECGRGRESP